MPNYHIGYQWQPLPIPYVNDPIFEPRHRKKKKKKKKKKKRKGGDYTLTDSSFEKNTDKEFLAKGYTNNTRIGKTFLVNSA
jgi:hypothetical protein